MDNIREAINQAVKNGRLDILMDFHRKYKNQCPWNEYTCAEAAKNGHLECLKYAHENGCPWDKNTCLWAAANGHLDCLEYAHKNGCPYPKYLLKFIIKKILIPKWRASVKVRFIIFYWMELGA